jgi:hypothetical protein
MQNQHRRSPYIYEGPRWISLQNSFQMGEYPLAVLYVLNRKATGINPLSSPANRLLLALANTVILGFEPRRDP